MGARRRAGGCVGGWDGESNSLGNFVEGRGAFAEPDSLARRMPRPLDADFSGASFFFSELRRDTKPLGDALSGKGGFLFFFSLRDVA
jgi:hypothetical protein